jgi:dipeptidyl aminopeptidase/acylaminoacyl peptidase
MITESHPDGFEKVSQIKPELFQYENRQGHTIHGYMIAPPDHKPEDKRPLLIYMYAGPLGEGHSVEDGAFGSTGYFFFQYLALEHGYIGVVIDPRGQSGYGAAHGNAHYNDPGRPATEDLQDGVNWLVENYGVDPERVGLTGWSFGGYQTQHAMYTAPETFKLGMAGAGPTEWQNYNRWYADGTIGPIEPGKPEQLDKFSLTHIAKNLEGPLMLIHGVEDLNVLYQDSVAVYREILRHGKGSLVEFVIDPTGGHGLGGDINRRDSHTIYLAFLLKHFGSYEPEALD